MRVHIRSREKDGGYTIRSTIHENPMLHANITAVGIGIFDLFGSCDLELDPMTFTHELDP